MMAESVNDVQTVHQNLDHAIEETDAALATQARLNRDLQQDLMRVRMVPFASLAERLHRVVRQTAKELGKRANLDIHAAQVELDRSVLERMTAPLEHMLRNAVIHGIEAPEERSRMGKAAIGEIRLDVSQEANEVVLALADDGAGLDIERIRRRALSMGLTHERAALSEAEIADFIFIPGVTTAHEVSAVAGRGVGMDVARSETASLGGRIELSFERGRGTRFVIYLPLTLAVTQAVLVRSGSRSYAIPAVMVEQVQQMRSPQLVQARDAGHTEWQERRYPFHDLAALLGAAEARTSEKRASPVLYVRSGSSSISLLVDEIASGSQEIVVKATGPQLARIRGIAGATVLGSGEIVLIINPVQLARREAASAAPVPEKELAKPVQSTVMVVDDSLTVRRITGRLLEREGYRVVTARDGVEAMELLQELTPQVMLVDIEMPRMDGFDLTRSVRADARLAGIPIVVISSRTADKHQQYASEIGVDGFLGKPYREEDLLRRVAGYIAAGRAFGSPRG
jgi:chemosensory pili system protein ChpA (sensor histidine kinase/response regulator)